MQRGYEDCGQISRGQQRSFSLFLLSLLFFISLKQLVHVTRCASYEFYLRQHHVSNYDNNNFYCNTTSEPCTSYCEIVNYINQNVEDSKIINIYLLNNFTYNITTQCQLSELNKNLIINFYGNNNQSTTINFEKEYIFINEILKEINFNFLTVDNLILNTKNNDLTFNNCIVNRFVRNEKTPRLNILKAFNSSITDSLITSINYIYLYNCDIKTYYFYSFVQLLIDNCKLNSRCDIFQGAEMKILNSEFGSKTSFKVLYLTQIHIENTIFKGENVLTYEDYDLHIAYVLNIKILNCKAFSKGKWLFIVGATNVTIDNLISTSVFDVLLLNNLSITNSTFYKSTIYSVRLTDISNLQMYNTNFTQCHRALTIENTHTPLLSATFEKCNFFENFVSKEAQMVSSICLGGAIYAKAIEGDVYFINCDFLSNVASNCGGAFYFDMKGNVTIENGKYIKNVAGTIFEGAATVITYGNGGAIYAQIDILRLSNDTLFSENNAIRGGAICTNAFIPPSNALIIKNSAKIMGGGIFSNNIKTLQNLNNLKDNTALIYGNDRTSLVGSSIVEYFVDNEKVDKLTIYPGQSFDLYIKTFDLIGAPITNILDPIEYTIPFNDRFKLVTGNINPLGQFRFIILQKSNFKNKSYKLDEGFIIHFSISSVPINFTITSCPLGFYEKLEGDSIFCEKTEFPIAALVSLIVIGAVVFFIIGIGFGILLIYIIAKVFIKLKRLDKKEKAELEMEKKIIDKQIVFGESMDTPLLGNNYESNYYNNNSLWKNIQQPSFIIPVEELELEKKIGEGGGGTVYSAKWGDNRVAIKSIKLSEENEDFEREVSLLSTLRHPNIVTFYGVTITNTSKYMVIEYLSKGSLKQAIYYSKIGKEILTLQKKLNILISIAQGMNYLHNLKPNTILHRDLKPENVLLDNGFCKVCDFGLSKIIGNASQTMTTNVGTLFYLSPEMLKGDSPSSITSKLDVYSFSIIMWELFFEENPYHYSSKINYFIKNNNNGIVSTNPELENIFLIPSLVLKGLRPMIPFTNEEELKVWINEFIKPFELKEMNNNVISDDEVIIQLVEQYMELMKQCWNENPIERPSFMEILFKLNEMKKKKINFPSKNN